MIQTRNVLTLVCAFLGAACADAAPGKSPSEGPELIASEADSHSNHDGHGGHGKPNKPGTPYPTKDPKALKLREQHVREIYESLVFPRPIGILTGATSVDHLFERESVRGRVTPVGQFPEFSAVVEYFYALAVTPGSIVDGVKFRSLLSGDDQVSVAVDIHFCRSPDQICDPEVPVTETSQTLTQVGFFRFNKQNRVISMDLNILNLGKASDPPNDPAVHAAAIGQLCTALTVAHIEPTTGAVVNAGTCTSYFDSAEDFPTGFALGANAFENCVGFMQSIPYGTWDRANSNTVTCRQLHTLLTAVDPDMHCPHASADGGGACIDFSYASYYDESF